VEPFRTYTARSRVRRLACLIAILLGIAILSQPNLATANGKGRGDTALPLMRGPGSGRSELSEMPAGGSVVLRGTRPPRPNASQPFPGDGGEGYAVANNGIQQGPSNPYQQGQNNTFQQVPLYGSGWDSRYDFSGLSGTYFPVPR
jgi:hypothetical protein